MWNFLRKMVNRPTAPAVNFEPIRARFGRLSQSQVDGINDVVAATVGLDITWRAYILATAWHETGGRMQPVTENMTYTSAERIRAVWPSRFPTLADAQPFVRNPEGLANRVYGNRMGNTQPNDGWKFRGRGHVQITGRDNYARFSRILNLDLVGNPDLALVPSTSIRIMVEGMKDGIFTGKRLSQFLPGDYERARQIVNKMDRARDIASLAQVFETALRA